MSETEQKIRTMVAEIAGISPEVPADRNLYLELGVASVHAMQLLAGLEEHFGVPVPDDDFVEATSIAKLAEMMDALVEDHRKDSAHA